MKTQTVRLFDVFLVGPLMIWGGYQATARFPIAGAALALLGAATVIYNGSNYLERERLLDG